MSTSLDSVLSYQFPTVPRTSDGTLCPQEVPTTTATATTTPNAKTPAGGPRPGGGRRKESQNSYVLSWLHFQNVDDMKDERALIVKRSRVFNETTARQFHLVPLESYDDIAELVDRLRWFLQWLCRSSLWVRRAAQKYGHHCVRLAKTIKEKAVAREHAIQAVVEAWSQEEEAERQRIRNMLLKDPRKQSDKRIMQHYLQLHVEPPRKYQVVKEAYFRKREGFQKAERAHLEKAKEAKVTYRKSRDFVNSYVRKSLFQVTGDPTPTTPSEPPEVALLPPGMVEDLERARQAYVTAVAATPTFEFTLSSVTLPYLLTLSKQLRRSMPHLLLPGTGATTTISTTTSSTSTGISTTGSSRSTAVPTGVVPIPIPCPIPTPAPTVVYTPPPPPSLPCKGPTSASALPLPTFIPRGGGSSTNPRPKVIPAPEVGGFLPFPVSPTSRRLSSLKLPLLLATPTSAREAGGGARSSRSFSSRPVGTNPSSSSGSSRGGGAGQGKEFSFSSQVSSARPFYISSSSSSLSTSEKTTPTTTSSSSSCVPCPLPSSPTSKKSATTTTTTPTSHSHHSTGGFSRQFLQQLRRQVIQPIPISMPTPTPTSTTPYSGVTLATRGWPPRSPTSASAFSSAMPVVTAGMTSLTVFDVMNMA